MALTRPITAALYVMGWLVTNAIGQNASVGDPPAARLLADTVSGSNSGVWGARPMRPGRDDQPGFLPAHGTMYFTAGALPMLYRTDGRPAGTVRLFEPGVNSPIAPLGQGAHWSVVFSATPVSRPSGVYAVSNDAPGGVLLAPDARFPNSRYDWASNKPPILGGRVLFAGRSASGEQLFSTDGTVLGTRAMTNLIGARILNIVTTPSSAYFLAEFAGEYRIYSDTEHLIWRGPAQPTWGDASFPPLVTLRDYLFFGVPTSNGLVVHTQSRTGHSLVTPLPGTSSNGGVWSFRNTQGLFFVRTSTRNALTRRELWFLSPAAAETRLIIDFDASTELEPVMTDPGMTLFISWSSISPQPVLWASDGTPMATFALQANLPTRSYGSQQAVGSPVGDRDFWFQTITPSGSRMPARLELRGFGIATQSVAPATSSDHIWRFASAPFDRGVLCATNSRRYNAYTLTLLSGSTSRPISSSFIGHDEIATLGNRILFWGFNFGNMGIEPHVLDLCPGDYTNNGVINAADFLDYLNDWFAASPNADMDGPGTSPTISDLFVFLNAWFTGC